MKLLTKKFLVVTGLVFVFLLIIINVTHSKSILIGVSEVLTTSQQAAISAQVNLPFHYQFSVDGTLDETGRMEDSWSPYWWLNSGGQFYLKNSVGMTVQGELSQFSKWRFLYFTNNPVDTDNGYHPQNIFRLITRTKWQNISEEAFYKINKMNLSDSVNRNASNGILLMNRYQDGNNLYYAGLRVDGYAVIKKKINGKYYTLDYKKVLPGGKYDRTLNPNLLPLGIWVGIKTEVKNIDSVKTSIKFFMDVGKTGGWQLVAEAIDDGVSYGGASIQDPGFGGIRTDFMDAEFDDFRINKI